MAAQKSPPMRDNNLNAIEPFVDLQNQ